MARPNGSIYLVQVAADRSAVNLGTLSRTGAWTTTTLIPLFPAAISGGAASRAAFVDSTAAVIAVAIFEYEGHTGGTGNVFISQDNGKSFSVAVTGAESDQLSAPWAAVMMPTPQQIDIVEGAASSFVAQSLDGGRTWALLDVPSVPNSTMGFTIGSPMMLAGNRAILPVFSSDGIHDALSLVEPSSNGTLRVVPGSSSLVFAGEPLGAVVTATASSATEVWAVGRDNSSLYMTSPSGTWTAIAVGSLHSGLQLSIADDGQLADLIGPVPTCAADKSSCSVVIEHAATADHGRHWGPSF